MDIWPGAWIFASAEEFLRCAVSHCSFINLYAVACCLVGNVDGFFKADQKLEAITVSILRLPLNLIGSDYRV